MKIFKILKTIFFTYFKYAENDGGIYFAHRYIYISTSKEHFFQADIFLFTLATTLVTLLELIFGVVFGPIFSS